MRLGLCTLASLVLGIGVCAQAQAETLPTDENGAVILTAEQNPVGLQPLPPPQPGAALFPRRPDGAVLTGLDTGTAQVNGSLGVTAEELGEIIGEGHFDLARVLAQWWYVEPQKGGAYFWDRLDDAYVATIRRGARPVMQLFGSPRWAVSHTGFGQNSGCSGNVCKQAPASNDPTIAPLWRKFAGAVARRYPLAAAVEVWNEPNLWTFWYAWGTDPGAYTRLLRIAHEGIKAENPAMRVLGGVFTAKQGTTSPPDGCASEPLLEQSNCRQKYDISLIDFFRGMLRAGAAQYLDGLSFHAKAWRAANPFAHFDLAYQQIEQVRQEEAAPAFRLVNSESGAKRGTDFYTEEGQSQVIQAMFTRPTSLPLPGGDRQDAVLFFESIDVHAEGWLKNQRDPATGKHIPYPVYCDMGTLLGGLPTRC